MPAKILSAYGSSSDASLWVSLMRFNVVVPSNDLLPPCGRSNTRNDGSTGGVTSSSAFPDDFLRAKPFGNLIGMEMVLSGWIV